MSKEKITNDQQHIIEALAAKNYNYVWEKVKVIGFRLIPDINERYMIFWDVVNTFDYKVNNNFIHFYLSHMTYYKASKHDTFYVTTNRSVIHALRNENISPSHNTKSKIANNLKDWSN